MSALVELVKQVAQHLYELLQLEIIQKVKMMQNAMIHLYGVIFLEHVDTSGLLVHTRIPES